MADVELHDEVVSGTGRSSLSTFRKQRNNERTEIIRARKVAEDCARTNP